MIEKIIQIKKTYLILFLAFVIVTETLLVLMTGLELFEALIVSLIVIYSILIIIDPLYSLILVTIISFFIEGEYIQTFVLFKLFGFNWYLMDLAFIMSFIAISYKYIMGEYRLKINSIVVWLIFFFVACLIGTYWGIKSGHPTQDVFFDLRCFFYYLMFIPSIFILNDFNNLKKLFIFILVLGTIKCTLDTFSSLYFLPKTFDDTTWQYLPFARLKGFNEVVYPLTLIASLSYFYFSKTLNTRLLLVPTIFFSFTALFLSYTRGSWLAAVITISVGLFLLIYSKRLKIKISSLILTIFFVVGILTLLSAIDLIPEKFLLARATSVTLNKVDISNFGRIVEYATGFNEFLRSPILGAGLGFKFTYFSPGIGTESTIYCHNSYLYVLTKMGIIGIVPFLLLLFSALKITPKVLNSDLGEEEIGIAFSFIMMLFVLVVKSLTTWHLNTVTFSSFVGVLFGISIIYKNKLKAIN